MATRRCRRWWCKRRKSELSGKKLSKNSGKSERPRHATAHSHAIARSLKHTRARVTDTHHGTSEMRRRTQWHGTALAVDHSLQRTNDGSDPQ